MFYSCFFLIQEFICFDDNFWYLFDCITFLTIFNLLSLVDEEEEGMILVDDEEEEMILVDDEEEGMICFFEGIFLEF